MAPLICARITIFLPLHTWKVKNGDKVGVIGLDGLDHMIMVGAIDLLEIHGGKHHHEPQVHRRFIDGRD